MSAALVLFGPAVAAGLLAALAVRRRWFTRAVAVIAATAAAGAVWRWLERRVGARRPYLRTLAALLTWLAVVMATGWLLGVASGIGPGAVALPGDEPVLRWFARRRAAWLTDAMLAVTWLGDTLVLLGIAAAVGGWWRWRRGSWRALAVLVLAYGGAAATFNVLKLVLGRARPAATLALLQPAGSAYPSGHAVDAAAFYLALVLVAAWAWGGRRLAGVAGVAATVVTLVLVSRLYLAVHWLSDVVAGALIGVLWTLGLVAILVVLWGSRWRTAGAGDGEPHLRPDGADTVR